MTSTTEPGDPRGGCCWLGKRFFDALKVTGTRLVFMCHSLLTIWHAADVVGPQFWCLASVYVLVFAEMMVVLLVRKGREWKWFQWSIFLYLISCLPAIWIVELDRLRLYGSPGNISEEESRRRFGVRTDDWAKILEQTMLVLIILGRWLMPKGDLTRDQLSSLLMMHLGAGCDIVDFLSLLDEDEANDKKTYVLLVLVFWTWSLCQFPFVKTSTAEDAEEEHTQDEISPDDLFYKPPTPEKTNKICNCCTYFLNLCKTFLQTEAWVIFVGFVLLDGPFSIIRILAITVYGVRSYTTYYFTIKNIIVIVLEIYRLCSIILEHKKSKKKKEDSMTYEELMRKKKWKMPENE